MATIVVVVVAGGSFSALFLAHVFGGIAMLVVTVAVLGGAAVLRPTFHWERWRPLLGAAAPIAAAAVVNVIYLRLLVVLMSLLADAEETGLFATSYRILEVFTAIPVLMMGAAFPILSYAGAGDDQPRLAYALQRMVEAGLLVSGLIALVLVAAAEPIVLLLGGDDYRDAAPVLQVQALALVGAFLTQVWALGLVAVHRQRALIVVNAVALATALAGGAVLIPAAGEHGAAIAAVIGELVLAGTCAAMLVRARPALRPQLGRPLRIVLAGVAAVAVGLIPGLPDVAAAVASAAIFIGLAKVAGAIPDELLDAVRRYGGER
jgi:O-antigen/teichoic acid export membrane protein